jgi:integrase
MTSEEKLRFKGRVVSEVFLFEPLKTKFFTALELYLLHEYLPTKEHEYVFQILEPSRRGVPYKNASDATRVTSFKRTVRRAGVPGPSYAPKHVWTPHSLRHAYGVYLLNYLPTPNGLGLRLEEVQYLMGHKDIKTTRGYARQGVDILRAKLLWADEQVSEVGFDLDRFRRLSRACYELLTMVSFGVCDAKTIPVT